MGGSTDGSGGWKYGRVVGQKYGRVGRVKVRMFRAGGSAYGSGG